MSDYDELLDRAIDQLPQKVLEIIRPGHRPTAPESTGN